MGTLPAAASLALLGSIVFAHNLTYNVDRAANFSRFKTYAWVRGTNVNDELNHKRIVSAIDAQLARKGFAKVQTSGAPDDVKGSVSMSPDVLVAYHASFDRDRRINGFSSGWGGYRFGRTWSGSVTADEIQIGTLVVDMVDARTKTIVWRGIATKEIDVQTSTAERERTIKRAAERLFRNYPPRK